jgi:hypothetical protein
VTPLEEVGLETKFHQPDFLWRFPAWRARARVGPYTIIGSYITATAAYGYETQIVYILAKDGKIIADDGAKVSFEPDRVAIDGKTGKPVADVTRCTYHNAGTCYVVSFERKKAIPQAILTDRAPLCPPFRHARPRPGQKARLYCLPIEAPLRDGIGCLLDAAGRERDRFLAQLG